MDIKGRPQKEKTGYFMTSGKIHLKPTHLTRLYYEILVISCNYDMKPVMSEIFLGSTIPRQMKHF